MRPVEWEKTAVQNTPNATPFKATDLIKRPFLRNLSIQVSSNGVNSLDIAYVNKPVKLFVAGSFCAEIEYVLWDLSSGIPQSSNPALYTYTNAARSVDVVAVVFFRNGFAQRLARKLEVRALRAILDSETSDSLAPVTACRN